MYLMPLIAFAQSARACIILSCGGMVGLVIFLCWNWMESLYRTNRFLCLCRGTCGCVSVPMRWQGTIHQLNGKPKCLACLLFVDLYLASHGSKWHFVVVKGSAHVRVC